MRWSPLARKECRTVLRSKGVWILALLVVVWGFRPTYSGWDALGRNITAGYVQTGASVFLPLGALLLGYQSLVGERTTGSLKFLLGLPLTRTHILLGKTAGRFAGVGAGVTAAFVVLGVVGLVEHGLFSPPLFVGMILATLLFVAALVAVAVAVSAVTNRSVTAAAGVFAFFLVSLFWSSIVPSVYTALTGVAVNPYDPPASGPLFFALRLTPEAAYRVVTNWLLGVANSAELFNIAQIQLQAGNSVNAYVVDTAFAAGTVPWYLHPALGLVILLAWLAVPLALARVFFDRGDAI